MRRMLVAPVLAGALLGGVVSAAGANPAFNDHNCAGVVVSSSAAPGFGSIVSAAAQLQAVDNFGLANCGLPPRNNP